MDKKEKKRYLQDYRWIVARIDAIYKELEKPIVADDVRFNGVKAEKDAVKHISKAERLLSEKEKLLEEQQKIEKAIEAVTNNKESILLNSLYISGKSAKEVASEMDISLRTFYRILDSAIQNVRLDKDA